jgi:uncharacterized membrane protein
MENKIKRTKSTNSYNSEEKTIIITIVVALLIIGSLLVYLISTPIKEEHFSVIYYLDSEKSTENLPKTVVLGENSTFQLWVGVENHNGTIIEYQVQMKIDDGTGFLNQSSADVIQSFERLEGPLEDGDLWEFQVPITIDKLGINRIIFELYTLNGTNAEPIYTGNWVNLSVEAYRAS